jgi:hypothetical protein
MREYCSKINEDVTLADDAVEYLKFQEGTTDWIGALIFFYGGSPEYVSRLKLEQVPPARNTTAGASAFTPPQVRDKKTQFVNDELENDIGAFGLYGVPAYQSKFAQPGSKRFYFVEGEFDALTIIARQCEAVRHDFLVLAGSGGGHSGADLLHNFGFDECYVIGDDDQGGERFAAKTLKETHQVACRVFIWPSCLKSTDPTDPKTDPDKAVMEHGFEAVEDQIRDVNNYRMPHKWAFARADMEMSAINSEDVRRLTTCAAQWGFYVTNSAERHTYIAEIAERYKIPAGPIWTAVLNDDDSETMFIQRIADKLARRFIILSIEVDNRRWVYRCFHRATRRVVHLPINDPTQLNAAISANEGKDILQFIHDDVGEPGFEPVRFADEEDCVYHTRMDRYARYINSAVCNLGNYAPSAEDIRLLGTGCHAFIPAIDQPDEEFRLYLVNGVHLYKGVFPTSTRDRVVWEECDGPRDGNIQMRIGPQFTPRLIHPQYPDAETLNRAPAHSIKETYGLIRDIIDTGWDFEKQDTAVDLLTALVMLSPISDVVKHQPMFMFTGDQSSGKSSIIGGLLGRDAVSGINVVQNALFMANFTPAGVRQTMNHSSICLCLDEFEDKGGNDKNSTRVRDVLGLVRGIANECASVYMGSASGKAQVMRLRFMICTAGIRGLRDPADLSRFIIIEMKRSLQRDSPETLITEKFGDDVFVNIRNELARLMYHHAYQVHQAHNEIEKEFCKGAGVSGGIDFTRTRGMLYGLMAVMKLAGRDYHAFIKQYFKDYRMALERLSRVSVSNSLFNAFFYTPAIRMPSLEHGGETEMVSVNRILTEGRGDIMNNKNLGIYYDGMRKWLLVHWPTAAPCLLAKNTNFRDATPGYLKSQASRGTYHLKDEQIDKSELLKSDEVRRLLGDVQITHLSGYNLHSFMRDSDRLNQAQTSTPVKGREVTSLLDHPRYKARVQACQFAKPPVPKKAAEAGTRGKTAAPASGTETKNHTNTNHDDEDDFDY